jgi:hypothetical protein
VPQSQLLESVVAVLDDLRLEYMLTGSLVSSLQGEPRATHDIDLVVSIREEVIPELVARFSAPHYYLSEAAVREAVKTRGMFNLLDSREGDKVDFWLLTDTPFDQSRFARRIVQDVGGLDIPVSSPEDTILAKLQWCSLAGGSEKQFYDALRVYEVQYGAIDEEYLLHWIAELSLDALWVRLLREAEPL